MCILYFTEVNKEIFFLLDLIFETIRMGFDIQRFVEPVHSELMCNICNDVLDDAVQVMQFYFG